MDSLPIPMCCWPVLACIGAAAGLLFLRCGWCKRLLGVKSAEGAEGGVSDGICEKCADELRR